VCIHKQIKIKMEWEIDDDFILFYFILFVFDYIISRRSTNLIYLEAVWGSMSIWGWVAKKGCWFILPSVHQQQNQSSQSAMYSLFDY